MKFQAWDQVQVTTGEFEGQAGYVIGQADDQVEVKLDLLDKSVKIDAADLKKL